MVATSCTNHKLYAAARIINPVSPTVECSGETQQLYAQPSSQPWPPKKWLDVHFLATNDSLDLDRRTHGIVVHVEQHKHTAIDLQAAYPTSAAQNFIREIALTSFAPSWQSAIFTQTFGALPGATAAAASV